MKSSTLLAAGTFAIPALTAATGNYHHAHLHQRAAALEKRGVVTETQWVTEVAYVTMLVDGESSSLLGSAAQPTQQPEPEPEKPMETKEEPPAPPPKVEPEQEKPQGIKKNNNFANKGNEQAYQPPPAAPQQEEPKQEEPKQEPEPAPKPDPVPEQPKQEDNKPTYPNPSSGGGGGGSGGKKHTGELTYYTPALGACGDDDSGKDNSENIIAVSHVIMGTQSNGNPMCGQSITVTGPGGKTAKGVVKDKCMGCAADNIDVTEKMFKEIFGDLSVGRDTVTWSFDSYAA